MAAGGPRTALREAVSAAARTLAEAGIDSARNDAEQLAAHVAGVERGRLALVDPPADFAERYDELIAARALRVPLQHLTGTAPFGPMLLQVGPGVFVPRPETEALLEWACHALDRFKTVEPQRSVTIVDLCTGSGALAVALAGHCPDAAVFAVENSPTALSYAARNIEGSGIELIEADVSTPGLRPELDGRVDLVVSNPPYIPDGAELEPEVAEHDPREALFGGPDGMQVIDAVARVASRWLRPGGWFGVEHDDTTSGATVELLRGTGLFDDVRPRMDLAGRPRFVTAIRNQEGARA